MAENSEDNGKEGGESQSSFSASGIPRRKKRPATLDLEATEVTTEDASGERQETPEPADTSADAPAEAPEPAAAAAETPEADESGGRPDEGAGQMHSSYGLGTVIGAAMIGGAASAAALVVLAYAGLLPQSNDTAALEGRLAQIDARLSQPAPAPDLGGVETELKALSDRLKATETATATVASLGEQVRAAETAAAQARDQMAGLSETLSHAEGSDAAAAAIASLSQQIATLKSEMANLAKASGEQADLAAKDSEIETLRTRVAELEQAPHESAAAAQSVAAATAASALTLGALERAVHDGKPYASELDAAKAIYGSDPAFAALERHAAKGVPNRAALGAEFETLADGIVAADKPEGDGSVLSKIVERASSIVQVRPVGYVDGDSVAAAVARAEVALNDGDLEGALSELGMLKGAARDAAGSFIAKVEARLAAERAVADLQAGAVARLNEISGTLPAPEAGESATDGAQNQ